MFRHWCSLSAVGLPLYNFAYTPGWKVLWKVGITTSFFIAVAHWSRLLDVVISSLFPLWLTLRPTSSSQPEIGAFVWSRASAEHIVAQSLFTFAIWQWPNMMTESPGRRQLLRWSLIGSVLRSNSSSCSEYRIWLGEVWFIQGTWVGAWIMITFVRRLVYDAGVMHGDEQKPTKRTSATTDQWCLKREPVKVPVKNGKANIQPELANLHYAHWHCWLESPCVWNSRHRWLSFLCPTIASFYSSLSAFGWGHIVHFP